MFTDPINREFILRNQGIQLVLSIISSTDEESLLSALTTLMFLVTDESKNNILNSQFIGQLINLTNSMNKRIKNLALIFLTDYCEPEEVQKIRNTIESTPSTS